jgi:hypothetical protein
VVLTGKTRSPYDGIMAMQHVKNDTELESCHMNIHGTIIMYGPAHQKDKGECRMSGETNF